MHLSVGPSADLRSWSAWFADSAVVEHCETRSLGRPIARGRVDQPCDAALGVDQDVFGPEVHVQTPRLHLVNELLSVGLIHAAQLVCLLRRVATARDNVVQQRVPERITKRGGSCRLVMQGRYCGWIFRLRGPAVNGT